MRSPLRPPRPRDLAAANINSGPPPGWGGLPVGRMPGARAGISRGAAFFSARGEGFCFPKPCPAGAEDWAGLACRPAIVSGAGAIVVACRTCGSGSLPAAWEGLAGVSTVCASSSPEKRVDCLVGGRTTRLAERALLASGGPTFRAGDNGTGSAAGMEVTAGTGEAASGFFEARESKREVDGAGWAGLVVAGAAAGCGGSAADRRKRRFHKDVGLVGTPGLRAASGAGTSAGADRACWLVATAVRGTKGFFCAMAGAIGRAPVCSAAGRATG